VRRLVLGRRKRWWAELVLVLVAYRAYGRVRGLVEGSRAEALVHARQVAGIERALHLLVEGPIQRGFLHVVTLVRAADVYYGVVHFVGPSLVFIYLWHWHRERYWYVRNVFAVLLGLALVGFWIYPLMPPRFMPGFDIIDTAARFGPWSESTKDAANLYAAMPSLHVGWSSWCVFALWPCVRSSWRRALLVAYPLLTLLVVMVTGNHWWLDGAGGVAALACSVAIVRRLSRSTARPDREDERVAVP
jgi:hypothetical protein